MDAIAVDGKKIRLLRIECGYTSAIAFAKALGLKDGQYMYQIERGESNPSLGLLNRMAHFLGVDISELLTESSDDLFQKADLVLKYAKSTKPDKDSIRGRVTNWIRENPHKLEILQKIISVNDELDELVSDGYTLFSDGVSLDEQNTMITFENRDPQKEPISVAIPQQSIKSIILLLIAGYVAKT